MRSRPPLGSLREEESRPVPLGARSSPWPERRGRRFPGTHLEPVVNISPGFPSTNSSARALPSPPPHLSRSRGPAFPSAPPPPSARRPSRPPLTNAARLPGGRGGGWGKGKGCPSDYPIRKAPRRRPSLRVQALILAPK